MQQLADASYAPLRLAKMCHAHPPAQLLPVQELVLQTKSKTVNLHECKCWANRMGNSGLDSIFISRFTRVLAAAAV